MPSLVGGSVDPEDIPDISDIGSGEMITALLIFVSLLSAIYTAFMPIPFYNISLAAGLSSIAAAILTVGRRK
ncbi:MAG: hypothetical protein ACFFE3_01285 [Candidatus Thorarchaeota archaeon]